MASIIIPGNFPNGLDLDNPLTNPVTITGTIELGVSGQVGALQGETVAAWDVTNQGSILGQTANGIDLLLGGTVTNDVSALVSGVFAVAIQGIAGTIVNAGTLEGGASGTGVDLVQGGVVTNQAGGLIQSGDDGVTVLDAAATVTNAGIINAGTGGAAVDLFAGGIVTNQAGGTLTGSWGISVQGAPNNSVLNDGVITGGAQSGVFLTGGTVTNLAGGTISGNWGIADTTAAGTVISNGTIIGNNGTAVTLASGFANRLVDDPGAVFTGLVDGGNVIGGSVVSTLELGAASLLGTLNGLGINFVDFGNIVVDPGASWALIGTNTLAAGATLIDQGVLLLNGATLIANGDETIAATAGDAASVTVTGGGEWGSFSTLVDGGAGNGAILINNQGSLVVATAVLGASAGSTGSIAVEGTGSGLAAIALTVGQGGGGRLTIENQAFAQVGGSVDIGALAGSTGNVTVAGTQSVLNTIGSLIVGDAGLGSLAIDAGGTVTTSADAIIANTASASNSSANVTGAGSNWQIAGGLIVGDAGFGSLSVSQSGTVTAASVSEAAASGGNGVITVDGTGSALSLTGSLTVGSQGAGEVDILGGGTITALDLTIGNASGLSSGNVDVEGAGSTLDILPGGSLNVGVAHGGSGVLTIGTNATLSFAGTVVEAGQASFNNNGGVIDPDAVQFTSDNNSGSGLNQYDLYVENLGAVQITGATGIWDTPTVMTGTSAADAANHIGNSDQGEWQLGGGGTLVINANTVDAGQAIVFEDAGDTLVIGQVVNGNSAGVSGETPAPALGAENLFQAGGFQAAIWGYQAGDQILFDNLVVTGDTIVSGNTLELFGVGNTDLGSLTFMTKAGSKPLGVTAMTAAAAQMACFAAGTLIETVDGQRAVETLAVGDEVVTLLGGSGRIVWVGSRAVDCARHPRPETVWPVRIAAGAFAANMPARDLFVSPDHAIYVDDVLIPAKHLVNGTTICQVPRRRVVYHHVELQRHDVVLAEGLPAESYLDSGERTNFSSEAATRLFFEVASPSAQLWETKGAAPLVVTGPQLEAVRLAIAASESRSLAGRWRMSA